MRLGEHTKIIATIGPATFSEAKIVELIKAGADLFRLNLSHGSMPSHRGLINKIRQAGHSCGRIVGIIVDLPGAKLRIPEVHDGLVLSKKQPVALAVRGNAPLGAVKLSVPALLFRALQKGSVVAIDDGKILLRVKTVKAGVAEAQVLAGGEVQGHKGITVLGSDLPLTEADNDKALGLAPQADFIGVSFVRSGADLVTVKNKIKAVVGEAKVLPKVIAKIETRSAVKNLNEIISEADAVMVARGDLGLAAEFGELAVMQKEIVKKTMAGGKPVIVATQMLDSMTVRPLPTRAEILDVANAVIDHVDAVMLSGETATGLWPKESVKVMSKIADQVEKSSLDDLALDRVSSDPTDLFVHTLADYVRNKGVKVIINENADLKIADLICRHRLEVQQVIPVRDPRIARQLTLRWGMYPVVGRANLPVRGRVLAVGQDKTGYYARIEKI